MNRDTFVTSLIPGLWLLVASILPAQIDTNSNGCADEWEKAWNNEQLFPPTFDPEADPDGDGWKNLTESIAGTNPFYALPPQGFIMPEINYSQPVYEPSPSPGIPAVLLEPPVVTLTWPTIPGKTYRVCVSPDLTDWLPASDAFVASGNPMTYETAPLNSDGTLPDKLFWRIETADTDSDGDTLTDYEEIRRGLNSLFPDTDRDGIPDNSDPAPLDSATFADPDGHGLANANLLNGLMANWTFEENSIPIANLFGKNEARCENHAATTAPSWPVLVPFAMNGTPTFLRRGFVSRGLPLADKSIFGDGKVFTSITNSFTLSFWHRFEKDSIRNGNAIYKCLWSLSDCRPSQSSIKSNTLAIRRISATEEEIYLGAYTWNSTGGNPDSTNYGKSFTRPLGTADDGQWHQYTIVRSAGKYTLLIDGQTMPGLNDATTPWLTIPLNKTTPTNPTDYNYDWNTFGRMAPSLAHNQTVGTFDRIRLWSRPLSPAETTSLYREDLDGDNLWDVSEESTSHWLDQNNDGVATEPEIFHHASPFLWQKSDHDTDRDGATDLVEQTAHTFLWNPDTDGDLIPDGWELNVSMNPLSNGDANLDPDQDGATNLQEYRHNTNPNVSNTDGDSKTDGEEINGPDGNPDTDDGSDPTYPGDNGVRPPDDQLVFFKLGVGDRSASHSEDYVLNVFRYTESTALETRVFTLRSGGFGEYKELTRAFRKDHLYTFQIQWLGSSRNIQPDSTGTAAQKPDYDYHMVVEPLQGTIGFIADSYDPEAKTHDPAFKLLDPEDVQPSDDDDDNVTDLPYTLSPKRVLFVPVIFERDLDMPDGTWQPMSGQLAKALPGQKLNLRVRLPLLPSRLKITDYEWVLPSSAFEDYTANQTDGKLTPMEASDLSKANVSFYLAASGNSPIGIKFSLGGAVHETTASLDVQQPVVNFTRKLGIIKFSSAFSGDLRLGLFENAPGDYDGIVWEGEVFVPAGWPQGKWNWVQTGTPNISVIENSGNPLVYSTNGQTGLDTRYPVAPAPPASHPGAAQGYSTGIPINPATTSGDSPSIILSDFKQCSYAANLTTYLMFLPDGTESRYVPLKSMNWNLSFTASKDASNSWSIQSQSVNAEQPQSTTNHPKWDKNISGSFVNQ